MTVFQPSAHQAAGHKGCLTSEGDASVFAKLTLQQEIDFYNETQRLNDELVTTSESQPLGSQLIDWMPTYMGTLTRSEIDETSNQPINIESDKQYIVLQNLYYGFSKPSILDIKLGKILYDETADEDKKLRMLKVSETTTSGSLGFRICGMKVYNGSNKTVNLSPLYDGMEDSIKILQSSNSSDVYLEFDKLYGRKLNKDNVKMGILAFFHNILPKHFIHKLLDNFHKRLQLLFNCMLDSNTRMISTSLLFIYESDLNKWDQVKQSITSYEEADPYLKDDFLQDSREFSDEEDDDEEEDHYQAPLSSLNLIDFAHSKYVNKNLGPDENVIEGIESLIQIFGELVNETDSSE